MTRKKMTRKKKIDLTKIKFKDETVPVKKLSWYKRNLAKLQSKMWYQKIVQSTLLKNIKSYFVKGLFVVLWGGMYLLVLRLFDYDLTWINLASATAVYFVIEEFKDYFLKFRGKRT